MNRSQLCKVLRAAATETGLTDLVVVGSQAVLGSHEDWALPVEAIMSNETDVAVDLVVARAGGHHDETELADRIDAAIGEGSEFHRSFGFYGQGVETKTAVLTDGWRDRLVPLVCTGGGDLTVDAVGWCLEINDLWVSKAAADRPKDVDYCLALAADDLVDLDVIEGRVARLPDPLRQRAHRTLARARARRTG